MKLSTITYAILIVVLVAAAATSFVVPYFYFDQFPGDFSPDQSKWGNFGDYIGGTLNPLLSFLSLIALLVTIVLQSRELEETRKEAAKSSKAHEQQVHALRQQITAARQKDQLDLTFRFIDQFFSKDFIDHRTSLWKTRSKVIRGDVSLRYIAAGYIYPIDGNYYEKDSETTAGLNEHQHLTLVFGYIERLGAAIRKEKVNREEIADALSYEFVWYADLLRELAATAGEMAAETGKTEPTFVRNIEVVLATLNFLKDSKSEIDSSHRSLRPHETLS